MAPTTASPQATPTPTPTLEEILNGPALAPPTGVTPNFVDPPNQNTAFIAVVTVCVALSTLLVLMRAYTRLFVIRKHDSSDYTCILGWCFMICLTACAIMFEQYGAGRDEWNVQVKDAIDITYWFIIGAMMYDLAMMSLKISILIQYRKIFVPMKKSDFMWWSTWILTGLILVFYITGGFIQVFFCSPVQKTWNPLVEGTCLSSDSGTLNVVSGGFNTATDFILLVMPLVAIWRLRLNLQKRLGIGSVFLIGLFACVSSCVRLYWSIQLATSPNTTYVGMQFALWTFAEATSAIICACLPVFPRFIQKTVQGSMLYTRLTNSLRSLISSRSGASASGYSGADRSGNYSQNVYNQRRPHTSNSGSEHGLKPGSLEAQSSEFEMDDIRRGDGITKTVDIQSQTKPVGAGDGQPGKKAW